MLNFLYKASMIILTINAIMFFVVGNQALSGQFNWVATGLRSDVNITSTSQVGTAGFPSNDINASIQQTTTSSTSDIPPLFSFLGAAGYIFNMMFYILFGFTIWMPMILPYPYWVLFAVPLAFIQIIGLFTLLQGIVGIMIFAIKSFI